MTEGKTLAQWRFEIKTVGRKHWATFYEHFLGSRPSNFPRFYKALANYGDLHLFEAIVLSSNQNLTGDPLSYVCKVAHELWLAEQKELDNALAYESEIQTAVQATKKKNDELAEKLVKNAKRSV